MNILKTNKVFLQGGCETGEKLLDYISQNQSNPKLLGKKLSTIIDLAKNRKGIRFLDVGCWIGLFVYHLSRMPQFKSVEGIDIERDFIEVGRTFVDVNANISVKNLFEINMTSNETKYDMILMSETIEHVDNPRRYISKIYDLLEDGGHFIIITPCAIGITNILLSLKHWKSLKYIETEKRGIGSETDHYYCWDKLTLFRLCHSIGFKYVSYSATNKFSLTKGQSGILVVKK